MNTNYKLNETNETNMAIKIASIEFDASNSSRISKERAKKTKYIIKENISNYLTMLYTRGNNEIIISNLSKILEYARNNFFEDLNVNDLKLIFNFAFGLFPSNRTPQKEIEFQIGAEEEEEAELEDEETIEKNKVERNEISKIAGILLPIILKQPEITQMFIEQIGGLYEIRNKNTFVETWAILSLASVAKISLCNRDEIFGFGFYYKLLKCISIPMPLIDFEASCNFAESLVEYEMSYPEQNQCTKEIFSILFEMEERTFNNPEFLDMARKLLLHVKWSEKYGEENQIHDIFTFFPTNNQSDEYPVFRIIEKNIDVENEMDKDEIWFEKSAKYIYAWLFFTFFQDQEQSSIQYDFNPLWHILLLILDRNVYRKASKIAASALTLLIQIDIDNFISNQYYENLVEIFPLNCLEIKIRILEVISITFSRASFEQMQQLVEQPNIFDLIFDTLSSIDFSEPRLPDVVCGLHHFVDFCGYSSEGMEAFNRLVIENEDFEEWVDKLIEYTNQLPEEPDFQYLIDEVTGINDLIHQRIDEYNDANQIDQNSNE